MFKVYEMTADLNLLSFGGRCISQVFYPIRLQIICLCIQSADLYLSLQSYISYIVPRHKGMHIHKETCSHIETTVSIGYYVKGCVLTQTTIIFFLPPKPKKVFFFLQVKVKSKYMMTPKCNTHKTLMVLFF